MGFESIIANIKSLPPFPESVIKLEEVFRSGEPDMKTIIPIIEGDPLLTAGILAKVNAPAFGLKNHIISVKQAVTLFGLNTVRALALKAAMERNFEIDMSPYGISNEAFSKISAMQNALMFQWYTGIDVQQSKNMIPLAFIMEIGKVVMANELIKGGSAEMFHEALAQSGSIAEVENKFTGITSVRVCALLFKHWYFEETFIELMENIENEAEINSEIKDRILALNAVRTAVNVKEQLSDASIEAGCEIVGKMGHDSTRFANACRRVREKLS